jgi:hypothetical protein
MKILFTLAAFLGIVLSAYGQGQINFVNSASTLISAGGVATLPATNANNQFRFALFVAPQSTPAPLSFGDPLWQFDAAYATNITAASGSGRITAGASASSAPVSIAGYGSGSTIDFIVRGWSANAGTTWSQALANWNNGAPLVPMYIGTSIEANDVLITGGGGLPIFSVFGIGTTQVPGFDMTFIPEPSTVSLTTLCGVAWLVSARNRNRRRRREVT